MFFHTWMDLGKVAASALLTHPILILFLRISGKRTLAKLNAFDLVVTVALGSTLSTIILSRDVAIVEGLLALLLLVALQYCVAWLSARSERFQAAVKARPQLLFADGRPFHDVLRKERLTLEELEAAARSSGAAGLTEVSHVVLETEGSLSVIKQASKSVRGVSGARSER
jgi:uncharacterized membrane protein YcaP (DUF421 family)